MEHGARESNGASWIEEYYRCVFGERTVHSSPRRLTNPFPRSTENYLKNVFVSRAKGLAGWDRHILENRQQLMALQVRLFLMSCRSDQ